jgi:hypothetical protein
LSSERASLSRRTLTTHASKQEDLDKLEIFWHNQANDAVQPRAVNLAYAEPCQNQGTAYFLCGPYCSESGPTADPHAGEAAKPTQRLRQSRIPFAGSSGERMSKICFKTMRPKPAAARLYASTAPGAGPAALAKVRSSVRRCAHFSEVRILENPDVCFEEAHPFSKRRNFSCVPSDCTRAGVCERPASTLRRRKNRRSWAKSRQAESQNRDLMRDLFQARRLPATVLASNRQPSCARPAWPRILEADVKFANEWTH